MSKKIDPKILDKEYNDYSKDFEKFQKALYTQLEEIIFSNDINLGFPIQSRIKVFESIIEKYESGRFNIKKSILELQDIIGFRVVLLFKRDVKNVEKLITDNFDIVKSYNTDDKLSHNEFGYSSKHFIIKIKSEWLEVPTFKNLGEYLAEIQVRTLSQHNWAETSNVLQYKDESNVPREILRSIGRVSALLETVDFELERTLEDREKYLETIIRDDDKNLVLNVDLLKSVLFKLLPAERYTGKEDFSRLLADLEYFDIVKVGELEELVKNRLEQAGKYENTVNIKREKESRRLMNLNFAGLIRTMLRESDPAKMRERFEMRFSNKTKEI